MWGARTSFLLGDFFSWVMRRIGITGEKKMTGRTMSGARTRVGEKKRSGD
jgi:hypothetical protein